MLATVINISVKVFLYALLAAGSAYLLKPLVLSVKQLYQRQWSGLAKRRRLLSAVREVSVQTPPVVKNVQLTRHLSNLLGATIPNGENYVWGFVGLSGAVGAVALLVEHTLSGKWLVSLSLGVIVMMIPYAILWVIRKRGGVKNSYEIVDFITILLSKYNAHQHNMYHALIDTLQEFSNSPLKRAGSRLLTRLQRHTLGDEAFVAVQDFAKQTDTAWATELALIIYQGYVKGLDVETSLFDLYEDITDIQKTLKDEKLSRTDTMAVAFMPIVMLPVSILYLDHSMTKKIAYLQFHTSTGINSLIFSAIVVTIGCVVALLLYKPKQDI